MAKNRTLKSIRLSDDIIEMIESQAGENFTSKFEALITRCMWELPRKEEELKYIQERIQNERKHLTRIQQQAKELENNIYRLTSSLQQCNSQVNYQLKNLEHLIEDK